MIIRKSLINILNLRVRRFLTLNDKTFFVRDSSNLTLFKGTSSSRKILNCLCSKINLCIKKGLLEIILKREITLLRLGCASNR